MIYVADITTPANRAASAPLETVLKVTKGLVYKVEFEFPPGAAGMHYCRIFDGGYQVWPSSQGLYFHSEDMAISFDDTYLKINPPFEFNIYTYNLDDTYPHFIQIRIGMVSKEVFMARFLPTYAHAEFKEILEGILAEQEARRLETIATPFPWKKTE